MIYLDYAAQAPVDNCVLDLFYNVTKKYYANPNQILEYIKNTRIQWIRVFVDFNGGDERNQPPVCKSSTYLAF